MSLEWEDKKKNSCKTDTWKRKKLTEAYYGIRGLLEKYPTFGREKETGLLGALDT